MVRAYRRQVTSRCSSIWGFTREKLDLKIPLGWKGDKLMGYVQSMAVAEDISLFEFTEVEVAPGLILYVEQWNYQCTLSEFNAAYEAAINKGEDEDEALAAGREATFKAIEQWELAAKKRLKAFGKKDLMVDFVDGEEVGQPDVDGWSFVLWRE